MKMFKLKIFSNQLLCIYIYNKYEINVWKSSQRMNLRDVASETSVNDTVQTNKNDKYTSKMLAQRYQKKMLKCNKNNYKSTIRP
jgi:hypothetical protein